MEHIIALYIPSAQSRGDHLFILEGYQVMNLIFITSYIVAIFYYSEIYTHVTICSFTSVLLSTL